MPSTCLRITVYTSKKKEKNEWEEKVFFPRIRNLINYQIMSEKWRRENSWALSAFGQRMVVTIVENVVSNSCNFWTFLIKSWNMIFVHSTEMWDGLLYGNKEFYIIQTLNGVRDGEEKLIYGISNFSYFLYTLFFLSYFQTFLDREIKKTRNTFESK